MDLSPLFKSIPLKRLLVYAILVGLLPLAVVGGLFYLRVEGLEKIEQTIAHLELLAWQKEKKQSVNKGVQARFVDADHFYIDKHLESLTFLNAEIQNLEDISNHPNFTEDEAIRNRLDFLTGIQNRLHFSEGPLQSNGVFQEVVETAAHAVQIDGSDLKKILTFIEGVSIDSLTPPPGRPQLFFLDFKLDKKALVPSGDVFLLNLKVLKREYQ
jgi:hypothetical protein